MASTPEHGSEAGAPDPGSGGAGRAGARSRADSPESVARLLGRPIAVPESTAARLRAEPCWVSDVRGRRPVGARVRAEGEVPVEVVTEVGSDPAAESAAASGHAAAGDAADLARFAAACAGDEGLRSTPARMLVGGRWVDAVQVTTSARAVHAARIAGANVAHVATVIGGRAPRPSVRWVE